MTRWSALFTVFVMSQGLVIILIFTSWYYYSAYQNELDGRLSTFYGLRYEIEFPKGTVRSGVGVDGRKWEQKMYYDYGHFTDVKGHDGEPLDLFMDPENRSSKIFRVTQLDILTGEFDEHKIMIGFGNIRDATEGYLRHYPHNWKGFGGIEQIKLEEIK